MVHDGRCFIRSEPQFKACALASLEEAHKMKAFDGFLFVFGLAALEKLMGLATLLFLDGRKVVTIVVEQLTIELAHFGVDYRIFALLL